jgi:hypothetical protein
MDFRWKDEKTYIEPLEITLIKIENSLDLVPEKILEEINNSQRNT